MSLLCYFQLTFLAYSHVFIQDSSLLNSECNIQIRKSAPYSALDFDLHTVNSNGHLFVFLFIYLLLILIHFEEKENKHGQRFRASERP